MTSAHRPTLDPAKGKLAPETGIVYERMLPGYTTLKLRQPGQGGVAGGLDTDDTPETESPSDAKLAIEPAPPDDAQASDPSSPSDSDSGYETDSEEDLRKELQKLRDNKLIKENQQQPQAKKRSWADETVFTDQEVSTPEPHRINDSLRSHKTKKFIKKYVQ